MVLPVPVSQNHRRVGTRETRSAKQPHADRLEIVRGDKHGAQVVFLSLALPVRPAHKRGSGIGVAQIDVVRIGPTIGRLARAHSRRVDFDQSLGFHATRRYREYSREIRNRDDGRHADSQRHDAHKRKSSSFCQRAAGMNQVIPDIARHILGI